MVFDGWLYLFGEIESTCCKNRLSSFVPQCGICMSSISVFEDPVDMPCGHEFCRGCWEG